MRLLQVKTEGTFPYAVIRHKPECIPFLYAYIVEELEEDIKGNTYLFDIEIEDCAGCAPPVDTRNPDEIPF